MNNSNFCHLHVHSEYSLLDGVGSGTKYAKRAKEMGFEYLACTDHGNIDGLIKHQKACEKEGIVPIFGCEMYICPDMQVRTKEEKDGHMTIIVKNQVGWVELCRLLTIANIDGFYKHPRIDYKTFLDSDLSGFIVLSGCVGSFLNRKLGEAFFWSLVEEMKKDLYLEVMPHDLPDQITHNKKCKELSVKYGIPLVGTNDCHYINSDENTVQEILLAVQSHAKWNDKNRWKFEVEGLYLKSYNEMVKAFERQNVLSSIGINKALTETVQIADKCRDFRIKQQQVSLPKIKIKSKKYINMTSGEILKSLCYRNTKKIEDWNEKYKERLDYELKVILEKKFKKYFLIVWDLVKWCRKNDIMIGSGRGSVGGSLVAYLLGITCVNPIKYNLLFSRFINDERIDTPDIDIDFEDRKRGQVRQYLEDKYGTDNISGISTFSKMKGRGAIRDIARVFDVPLKEVTEVALKLEGTIKNSGQHASALIISSENLKDGTRGNLCRRGKNVIVSNWDMEDCEYMGLMKLDVLGLSTLSVLSETKKLVMKNHNQDIIFEDIEVGDKRVLQMLSEGNTVGVFQLSTPLSTDICKRIRVDSFEDIASVLSLARPGALHSGMTDEYINRKHGGKWVKKHPIYEEITKNTYGVLIYQEQVMEVFHKVAGLPYSVADNIRKIIGKKRDVSEFEQYKNQFLEGCKKMKTFSENDVEWFWDMLLKCSNYLFNRSHAIEYAMLAYWTSFCKYFYPTEFICACLTYGGDTKKNELIEEAKRLKLKIIPPKIELSNTVRWKAKDNCLYIPFIEIKGFGESTARKCLEKKKPKQQGFFNLFTEKETNQQCKTKVDKILNEIKAFDNDAIPTGINKYFSFNIETDDKVKAKQKVFRGFDSNLTDCDKCELIKECNKPVSPSSGKYNVMIVSEAPGFEEDKQGRGFVGRAGKFLWKELEKYNLERKMFHVSNICKCFPSKTKTPNEKQIKTCFSNWLKKEIEDLECQFILTFGNSGLKAFSDKDSGITGMNGKIEWSNNAQALVCYVVHPAGVLRGSTDRKVFSKGIKTFVDKFEEFREGD